jgi:hypothetical protein
LLVARAARPSITTADRICSPAADKKTSRVKTLLLMTQN